MERKGTEFSAIYFCFDSFHSGWYWYRVYTEICVQSCWPCVVDYSLLFAVKSFLCSCIYVGVAFSLHTVTAGCSNAHCVVLLSSCRADLNLLQWSSHLWALWRRSYYFDSDGFNITCSIKLIFLWRDVWAYARKLLFFKSYYLAYFSLGLCSF